MLGWVEEDIHFYFMVIRDLRDWEFGGAKRKDVYFIVLTLSLRQAWLSSPKLVYLLELFSIQVLRISLFEQSNQRTRRQGRSNYR
jgi:hypothetical protein